MQVHGYNYISILYSMFHLTANFPCRKEENSFHILDISKYNWPMHWIWHFFRLHYFNHPVICLSQLILRNDLFTYFLVTEQYSYTKLWYDKELHGIIIFKITEPVTFVCFPDDKPNIIMNKLIDWKKTDNVMSCELDLAMSSRHITATMNIFKMQSFTSS